MICWYRSSYKLIQRSLYYQLLNIVMGIFKVFDYTIVDSNMDNRWRLPTSLYSMLLFEVRRKTTYSLRYVVLDLDPPNLHKLYEYDTFCSRFDTAPASHMSNTSTQWPWKRWYRVTAAPTCDTCGSTAGGPSAQEHVELVRWNFPRGDQI